MASLSVQVSQVEVTVGQITIWYNLNLAVLEISLLLNSVRCAAKALFPVAIPSLISCSIVLSGLTKEPKYL
jgi:anaerobic C4-dicarboxylate transporter